MSFSSEIKEKLSKIKGGCSACSLYELSGFMGNVLRVFQDKITIATENEPVAKKMVDIIKKRYKKDISLEYAKNIYRAEITDKVLASKIIEDTKYLKRELKTERDCCQKSYIRGAFLGGGSINNPQKSYHLEFDYKFLEQAEKLKEMLLSLGIFVRVTKRKGHTVLYIKEYEAIADVLGLIGAGGAAIEIYNISAEKELRNEINRQMNCENANMDRIASAYCRHLKAIEKIERTIGLAKLPDNLREAAEIRKQYPEDGLKDLGMKFKKPIGKSGVNHRLNKIIEIADNL